MQIERQIRQVRSFGNYFASGLACGLGGMLLVGVPSCALAVAMLASTEFATRHGFPMPDWFVWFDWLSRALAVIGVPLASCVLYMGVVVAPAVGFVFGWWAGMHHPKAQPRRRVHPTIRSTE